MRLRVMMQIDIPVLELAYWESDTLEGAAANLKRWCDDGSFDAIELLEWGSVEGITVTPIHEDESDG